MSRVAVPSEGIAGHAARLSAAPNVERAGLASAFDPSSASPVQVHVESRNFYPPPATAMLSTAGATNATLYASGGMTGILAKVGLFPSSFGPGSRLGARAGLLITGGAVLVVANLVDLSAIASVGSATALVLFLVICAAAYRLRASTGSSLVMILPATAVTAIVLVSFSIDTLRSAPETFTAMIAIGVVAIVFDALWRARKPAGVGEDSLPRAGAAGPG